MEQQDIRVLVVDDEESIRSVIVQVLSEEGYSVSAAASAPEALRLFRKAPADIVITDIKMPDMSGIDLLIEIKKISPDTEVVIITSHASLDTAISAVKHGAYDYLQKPFEDIDLIAAVARRISQKILLVDQNRRLLESLRQKTDELDNANKILRQMVIRDDLTGAYNHRYFHETLAQELLRSARHEHQCSIVFLDVDDFKRYNDNCGHPRGDEILRALAATVTERLRRSDLLARYGGEEFVILLPETTKQMALKVAEDIRAHVETFPFPDRHVMERGAITVSAGVATYPVDGKDTASIVKHADTAMYEAKRGGKNQVR